MYLNFIQIFIKDTLWLIEPKQISKDATYIYHILKFLKTSLFFKIGYYGEGILYNSGMTIAVKSHGFTTGNFSLKAVDEKTSNSVRRLHNHMKELNSTAIVLIRNPFKAIISHRHLDEGGHTGHAKAGSFIGKGWDHFVTVKVKSWELFYTDWLTSPRTVTKVVHFENLQDSSTLQWNLLNVIDFLGKY